MKILIHPDKKLRRQAKPVEKIDDDTRSFADELAKMMLTHDGVGLAAIQVGDLRRIIAVNIEDKFNHSGWPMPLVLINPDILEASLEKVVADEACLSLPGLVGPVSRHQNVIVNAVSPLNELIHLDVSDWFARVLQHEIDHLNGILFTDHISDKKLIQTYEPKDNKKKAD